jgi:hypothetical protein
MTAPVIVVEERDGLLRLLDALRNPSEKVDGWDEAKPKAARIVYASPLLVHHSALVDMKRKQDQSR